MGKIDLLWPTPEAFQATLGSDAHTLDTAAFLAVHQPMVFRRLEFGKHLEDAPEVREHDLLTALLAPAGEGRVIVPIAGPSGSGKSHVIRWLEAELLSRPDAADRHVILVPKSASLKSVLRLILKDLDGSQYDEIRASLERASESLPEVAAMDLRTRLVAQLKTEAQAASHRLRERSSQDRRRDEQAKWGETLADLLLDPGLWKRRFYGPDEAPDGVMARLAKHVTEEGLANRRHQFEPADFEDLTRDVDSRELSADARRPVQEMTSERYRQLAADVLNGVLDQATQNLLDLGGTPLSEVFLELRKALLKDGKELVILVEDFAALSGMQGALLDALIHEARVGGKTEYCTIRSALAYTQGYQAMDRDTVKTRAGAEWLIEETPGTEENILSRALELVGAYWNAARWGIDELKGMKAAADGEDWVQRFIPEDLTDEEVSALEAFGRSDSGYPLFPLNAQAIRQLVREKSVVSDQLVFNPRLIIDRVVFDVAKLRAFYEASEFPPGSLGTSRVVDPEIIHRITEYPDEQRERVLTLLSYWGELPNSPGEAARMPHQVFESFDLSAIDFGIAIPDKAPAPTPTPVSGEKAPPSDPFQREWEGVLGEWQRGGELPQATANNLRKWITEAVYSTVPQDWPGSRPSVDIRTIAQSKTYLPRARGAAGLEESQAAISLCTAEVWKNPLTAAQVRRGLESVVRYHGMSETKGTWKYSGGSEHAAHYSAFIAERRRRLISWLRDQDPDRQNLEGLTPADLLQVRLFSSALLGAAVKSGKQLESAVSVLFDQDLPTPSDDPQLPEPWQAAQKVAAELADKSIRDLTERIAARQGTGSSVYALDVSQIAKPLRNFLKDWSPEDSAIQGTPKATLTRGINARREELHTWTGRVAAAFGSQLEKNALIEGVRAALTEAKALEISSPATVDRARTLLDSFRNVPVAQALENATTATSEAQVGIALPLLAHDYGRTIAVTTELCDVLEGMFEEADKRLSSQLEASGAGIVKAVVEQVSTELRSIAATIEEYDEVRSS